MIQSITNRGVVCSLNNNNKKVIGQFKDEMGGKIMSEFVRLRAKLYVYKYFSSKDGASKCNKKLKGRERKM